MPRPAPAKLKPQRRHDGVYGWRGRIGHLYPSSGLVGEQELSKMLPDGVALYTTRMYMRRADYRGMSQLLPEGLAAIRLIASAGIDLVAFNCTIGSLLRGPDYEETLRQRLARAAGVPVITTAGAAVQAFRKLGVRAPLLLTAYKDAMNRRERVFLRAHGVTVPAAYGLGLDDPHRQAAIEPQVWLRLYNRLHAPAADSVFISCAGSPAVDIIEDLEKASGRPVVTSNQGLLWACLRELAIDDAVPGFGRLLRV